MASKNFQLTDLLIHSMERRWLPDSAIRLGIRRLLRQRLASLHAAYDDRSDAYMDDFIQKLETAPVADETDAANEQHYELPTSFFELMLGPRLKYSSGLWGNAAASLKDSEEAMLSLTCQRAQLESGMDILELGCGWGSLSLWMAETYPGSQITAVSNSATQREHIMRQAAEKELANLNVITADMNEFEYSGKVDRIVSVEMFEHMRNYRTLFERCRQWLKPEGVMFLHVFSHHSIPYLFEDDGPADWMSRNFFSGGTMPSHDLFRRCQNEFEVETDWKVNGLHYSQTLEAWLRQLDSNRGEVLRLLTPHYGADAEIWLQRWRIFNMACSELFAYNEGNVWQVSHYRMVPHGR